MIVALALTALAADPAAWPLAAPLDVPADGAFRVDLPAEWVARCPDPSTYLLHDPDGVEVPFAVRTSDDAAPTRERLRWQPRPISPTHWQYRVLPVRSGQPAVALSVRDLPRGSVARVSVRRGDAVVATGVVWNLPDTDAGVGHRIDLPPTARSGPWLVDVWTVRWPPPTRPDVGFEAVVEHPGEVAEVRWTVPATRPVPTGPGTSGTTLELGRAGLRVRGWTLHAEESAYARPVELGSGRRAMGSGEARRVEVAGLSLPETGIRWRGAAPALVEVHLTDDRSPPLALTSVDVALEGVALLVPEGRTGTWTLAGCGPTNPPYDVERLGGLLVERPLLRVRPSAPAASRAWTAAAATSGLAGPGRAIRSGEFRHRRAVEGPAGLTRLRLPVDVVAGARGDLADLRVLGDGHLVPHLVAPAPPQALSVDWAVVSEPGRTVVTVGLPAADVPVERLVLYTSRGRFDRGVRLLDGARPVLGETWRGPGPLVLDVDRRVGPSLTVEIDDGDDGPLPLDDLQVTWRTADVVFVNPPSGSRLSWADARRKPAYDLRMLRDELLATPSLPATLGAASPVASYEPAPMSPDPPDVRAAPPQAAIHLAVLVLALVLGGIAVRLAVSDGSAEGQ